VGRLRLVEVPAVGDEAVDVDTWADLEALRRPGE
jgi:CTP:molybdopterin cytidylyltransferase MocA